MRRATTALVLSLLAARPDLTLHGLSAAAVPPSALEAAVASQAGRIAATLSASPTAVSVVDNLLGADACAAMRAEAEAVRAEGWLEDAPSSGDVRSTQQLDPLVTPELCAYSAAVARGVSSALKLELADGDDAYSVKLAVAERVGAAYGRHIDTNPGGDPRKVTLIYYLNPGYDATQGGRLRSFGGGAAGTFAAQSSEKKDSSDSSGSSSGGGGGGGSHDAERRSGAAAVAEFEPRGDRLVAFWSDALVHDVSPTTLDKPSPRSSSSSAQLPEPQQQQQQEQQEQQQASSKEEEEEEEKGRHRWALTVWLRLRDASLIRERDPAAEDLHFGRGAFRRALARAAVKGGDAAAEFMVGECYRYGRGTAEEQSPSAAASAAAVSSSTSSTTTTTTSSSSVGGAGKPDFEEAAVWFRRAASRRPLHQPDHHREGGSETSEAPRQSECDGNGNGTGGGTGGTGSDDTTATRTSSAAARDRGALAKASFALAELMESGAIAAGGAAGAGGGTAEGAAGGAGAAGGGDKTALEWYLQAAELGHAGAAYALGTAFTAGSAGLALVRSGDGTEGEDGESAAAAAAGAAGAVAEVSSAASADMMEDEDEEVAQILALAAADEREALRWYRVAAEAGHARAQYEVAYCLGFGVGSEADEEGARRFLALAARQSHFLTPREAYPLLDLVLPPAGPLPASGEEPGGGGTDETEESEEE